MTLAAAPLDLTDPAVVADPYPAFAAARAQAPVQWHEGLGMWLAFTHTEVNSVLRDRRLGRIWSDKQPVAREFTGPAEGAVVRSSLAGVGAGDVATLVADSGGPVAGQVGGLTATVASDSSRATMLTVVLAPSTGAAPPPANVAPEASFASLAGFGGAFSTTNTAVSPSSSTSAERGIVNASARWS